ncbi:MAG: hypothetical protein EBS05_25610 [Proteobacteria bacterium]|nr:hypothetical protein [Pseudomonadota bacterium]
MHAPVAETNKRRVVPGPKPGAVALVTALIATSLFWVLDTKYQQVDEIREHSLLLIWVVVNLPAILLYSFTSDEITRFNTDFYLCVFLQWLGIGYVLGLAWVQVRQTSDSQQTKMIPPS